MDVICKETTYELIYTFDTKPLNAPIITGLKEKEIPNLNLKGSENIRKYRDKYIAIAKRILIGKLRRHRLKNVFFHFKRSRISLFFPQLMSFITSELKRIEKSNAPVFLKAVYHLFLNEDIWFEKNVSSYIVCTTSLKKLLINLLKSCAFRYLLKDLAADILSEISNKFLSGNVTMPLSHDLKEIHEDSYGGTVKWLLNVTPVTDAKLIHSELSTLKKKAFNSPRMFRKLLSVCEPFVYSATPSQKNILFNLSNLLRYEAIFTTLMFDVEYETSYYKIFHFYDLFYDHVMLLKITNTWRFEILKNTEERKTRIPMEIESETLAPFFVTDETSSFIESGDSYDFSCFDIIIDQQLIFFGYFTPLENGVYDYYFREKESVYRVSTSPPYSDTNIKLIDQDIYDPFTFKISDGLILFQRKRSSKKRKFSAIS